MLDIFVANSSSKKEFFFLKKLMDGGVKTIGLGFEPKYKKVIDATDSVQLSSIDDVASPGNHFIEMSNGNPGLRLDSILKKLVDSKAKRVVIDDLENFSDEQRKKALKTLCKAKVEFIVISNAITSIDFLELMNVGGEMNSHTIYTDSVDGINKQFLKPDSEDEEIEILYEPSEIELFSKYN